MIKICLFVILFSKIYAGFQIIESTVDKCGKTCPDFGATSKEYEDICNQGCDLARGSASCSECNTQYPNMPAKIFACTQGCLSYNHTQVITKSDSSLESGLESKGHANILFDILRRFMPHHSPFPSMNLSSPIMVDDGLEQMTDPFGLDDDTLIPPTNPILEGEGNGPLAFFNNWFGKIGEPTSSVAKKGGNQKDDHAGDSRVTHHPKMKIFIFRNAFDNFFGKAPNTSDITTEDAKDILLNDDSPSNIENSFFPSLRIFTSNNNQHFDVKEQDEGETKKAVHHSSSIQVMEPLGQPMEAPKFGNDGEFASISNIEGEDHFGGSPTFIGSAHDTLKTFFGCIKNLRFPPWFLFVSGMLLITLFLWLLISVMIYSKKSKRLQKLYLSDSLEYILPYQDEKMMENKELILEPALPVKIPVEKI